MTRKYLIIGYHELLINYVFQAVRSSLVFL